MFEPDPHRESQCIERLRLTRETEDYNFKDWPREDLRYLVEARGGQQCVEWMDGRLGWYRLGGPRDELEERL